MSFEVGDFVTIFSNENHSFPICRKKDQNFIPVKDEPRQPGEMKYFFRIQKNTKIFGVVVQKIQQYVETNYDKQELEEFVVVMLCNVNDITFIRIHQKTLVMFKANPENKIEIFNSLP